MAADIGSVTICIGDLRSGGDGNAAAQLLWERYWVRILAIARRYRSDRAFSDEEDAAQSAFYTLCRGVRTGRYPQLASRDDLWRLLVVMTRRKASKYVVSERRKKRGAGNVIHEAALAADSSDRGFGLDLLVGHEPTPEFAAEAAEQYARLLALLGDEILREIAISFMEGYTAGEIAARLNRSRVWVQHKKDQIRKIWACKAESLDAGPSDEADEG